MDNESAEKFTELNVSKCPLSGTIVVEAGAGTGKTYNITEIYLRLILEGRATADQILVVTFTEAATKELRTRLRKRLTEALEKQAKDSVENSRLKQALSIFDAAPVFTIHGFCHRMLQEHTFESGIRYGQELRGDPQDNITNAYANFYRHFLYNTQEGSPSLIRAKLWQELGLTPDGLKGKTRNCLGKSRDKIIWADDSNMEGKSLEEILNDTENFLREKEGQLNQDPKNDELRKAYQQRVMKTAIFYVGWKLAEDKEQENFMTFDDLLKKMRERLKSKSYGQEFRKTIRDQFKYAFIDEFQDTDDVQNDIFRMLFREDGMDRQEDRALFLIGDPKQAIYGFRNGDVFTYLDATKNEGAMHRFSLTCNWRSSQEFIGALNAMRERRGEDFFLLGDMIRFPEIGTPSAEKSERHLLKGNEIVTNENNALLHCNFSKNKGEYIEYMIKEIHAMVKEGRLNFWEKQEGAAPQQRRVRYKDIAVLCKSNGDVTETAKDLSAAGIPCAIVKSSSLFGTDEAKQMLKFLQVLLDPGNRPQASRLLITNFVPKFSVVQLNTLAQKELNLPQKLRELLEIWQKESFRAMFSAFLNSTMTELLGEGIPEALEISDLTVGKAYLTHAIPLGSKAPLAILQQVQEALQKRQTEERLGVGGLVKFLQDRIANADDEADAYPLRRSTEDDAVQLLTIHKSKGLEFPIVYVLGLLTTELVKNANGSEIWGTRFHDRSSGNYAVRYDMTGEYVKGSTASKSDYRDDADQEATEELLRLFYVAVTRAQYLCRVLAGNRKFGAFHKVLTVGEKGCLPYFGEKVTAFLSWLQEGTTAEEEKPEEPPTSVAENFPKDNIALPRGWCTCSFSSLAQGGGVSPAEGSDGAGVPGVKDANSVEEDEGESDPSQDSEDNPATGEDSVGNEGNAEELAPIFRFPRGKLAGTCWHEILEFLDFQGSVESQRASLWEPMLDRSSQLPKNAPDEREARIHAFGDMLEGVLETALPDPADPSKRLGFALKDIPQDHRRSELRFFFRLKNGIRGSVLAELLDSHKIPRNTDWAPTRGKEHGWVLNGSLDLLFQSPQDGKYYILDWKTNALNQRMSGFDQDGMEKEMQEHFYHLQYLLYTVAFLHAYQSLNRDWTLTPESYDRLFGGVLYCFLRGVTKDSQDTNGFYARRPEFTLIEKLFDELQPCANPDAQ